jgi:hypothetical protein
MLLTMIQLLLLSTVLCIGAQSVSPNANPSAASKSSKRVRQLNTKHETDSPGQKASSSPPAAICDRISPCYVIQEERSQTKEEKKKSDSLDLLYRGYLGASIVGVLFALFGLYFIFKQTRIANTSAKAALSAAEAVINGDRCWLLVQEHNTPEYRPETGGWIAGIILRNFGKTPAKITALKTELQIGDRREIPPNISLYTDVPTIVVPELIPQGIEMPITVKGKFTEAEYESAKFIWMCGIVRYENIFRKDPSHLTSFCYLLKDDTSEFGQSWYMAGPAEYNKTT